MRILRHSCALAAGVLVLSAAANALAQAPLPIYTDNLVNGFQDWSWAPHTLNNTAPVHSGSHSISVSGSAWQALSFYHAGFNTTPYASVSFWAHGGATGGQVLQVYVSVNGVDQPAAAPLTALSSNTWQRFDVPLPALNADSQTNVSRFYIQLTGSGTATTFYVDDVQLTAKPAPAMVHLSVDATQAVRQVDFRWFAVNTAIWDSNFDTPTTVSLLQELGTRFLRFPGGSLSDEYHWATDMSLTNTWQWATSFSNFVHVATNVGAQALITVNYGTGTSDEAAGWVRHANVTNHLGFKYWEIGNECYGNWETDSNTYPHDPYTYAMRARDYILAMRAADPTIRIGVVSASGENSYSNQYSFNHPVVNLRTGQTNYGWTPIVLNTLKNRGITPDFLIEHNYPEYTGSESDSLLLQSTSTWASEAADLRQQIADYLGDTGTNVELVCTENNSNSGSQGKQSTSLVNGVYYADSLGRLMQTELNAFVWWDLRNGTDTSGSFDPTLYGWRTIGDLGMVNGLDTLFPTFYAAKLMHYFAQPGDTILSTTSDYMLLSAYGARGTNGAVSLLVLNKDTTTNFDAQVALPGFTPEAAVTMRSYGMPQDNAAQSGVGSQDIAQTNFITPTTNFSGSFPPLSLTLLTLSPMRLAVQPALQTVVAGNTTTYTASITPVSWLTNSVTLSVAGLPAGVTAAFSPPSVSGSGSSMLSVTPGYVSPGSYPLTILASGDGLTNAVSVTLTISLGVVTWGANDFGQSTMPGALSNAVGVSAGGYHNLALRADGSVLAWGDDLNGQCDVPPDLTNVVAIAAGGYHSLALRTDGSIVAWGDDSSGQTDVPASATNVVAIGAGGWHSLALRSDGTVIAWGDNSLNQTNVPAGLADVVAIAAGGQHSLALRSDGTVAAWGSRVDAYGDYAGQIDVPAGLSQVVAVAAGGYHSLALRADGTVAAWGLNSDGQAAVPAGLSGVVEIAAGEAHSLALRADGAVVAWGDNTYGQCSTGPAWTGVSAIAAGGTHSLELIGQRAPGLQLGNPLQHGATFTLSLPTVMGRAYFLQYKGSVTDTNWVPLSGIVGDGGVKMLTDPAATTPHRFYRVRQK